MRGCTHAQYADDRHRLVMQQNGAIRFEQVLVDEAGRRSTKNLTTEERHNSTHLAMAT